MKDLLYIVMGVTDGCNLECRYCFKDASSSEAFMDHQTLTNLLEQSLGRGLFRKVVFIWHGGEPTLSGIEYYREIVALQRQYKSDVLIENQLQTNGVLGDRSLLDFFIEHGFHLGVSLDGPEDLHDAQRAHRSTGSGTYSDVLGTIEYLKVRGVPVGVIAVVTRLSLPRCREMYFFLTSIAGSVKFRPMNWVGAGLRARNDLGITPGQYSYFLKEMFPLWLNDPRKRRVNPFSDALTDMVSGVPQHCSSVPSCARYYIAATPHGDIYSCSGFVGNIEHFYGNINDQPLEEIVASPRRQRLVEVREQVDDCLPCEYRTICNAGCMLSTRMAHGDIAHKDFWCAAHKTVFELVKSTLIERL